MLLAPNESLNVPEKVLSVWFIGRESVIIKQPEKKRGYGYCRKQDADAWKAEQNELKSGLMLTGSYSIVFFVCFEL